MNKWTEALNLAVSGFISVFLALAILQITVILSSKVISGMEKRKAKKEEKVRI